MSSANISPEAAQAIKQVHDGDESMEWVLIGYENKGDLNVLASGTGALTELSAYLPQDAPAFGLIRYPLVIDKSRNTRFAFIDWTPEGVHPMAKSLVSTQKGAIKKVFEPIHVDLMCSDPSDLDESVITKKIGLASGTAQNIVETKNEQKIDSRAGNAAKAKSGPSLNKVGTGITLKYLDEEDFKMTMKEIHSTEGANNFVLGALNGETLEIVNRGNGTTEDMLAAFNPEAPSYGLIRVVDFIDKKPTVKFAFIVVMPASVPPMRKAKLSTMTGAIQQEFRPYHVEFFVEDPSEVSHQDVVDKIGAASGSKNNVK